MKFRTEIEPSPSGVQIGYENRVLTLGSCFAAHIAGKLAEAKFRVTANPSGILFNPLSIAAAIRSYADPAPVGREELGFDGRCGTISGSTAISRPRRPKRRWKRPARRAATHRCN